MLLLFDSDCGSSTLSRINMLCRSLYGRNGCTLMIRDQKYASDSPQNRNIYDI